MQTRFFLLKGKPNFHNHKVPIETCGR